ncbi:hypothetical protein MKZ38_000434 [Zalerion maritima]|uniref:RNase MRP protein 1 RNA binding domain-containing protein n=1 Tax=Zalerion maritima TaxID=339359 RepID=A0AAD5RXV8_9PEZI|nr:hypothetical protein MKZ38_000434 [Zalerion maritima]
MAPPTPTASALANSSPATRRLSLSDPMLLGSASDALSPIPDLLLAFAHRNKNQHRRSRWWCELGMLRRNLGRLVSDVEKARGALREVEERERARKGRERVGKVKRIRERERMMKKKGKRVTAWDDVEVEVEEDGRTGKEEEGGKGLKEVSELRELRERAIWMKNILTPKVYHAFGQLTADNQFAPMGLMLLGVLARVYKVLGDLAGEHDVDVGEKEPGIGNMKIDAAETKKGSMVSRPTPGLGGDRTPVVGVVGEDGDFGVAVSRKEDEAKDADERPKPEAKIKSRGPELDTIFGSILDTAQLPAKTKSRTSSNKTASSSGGDLPKSNKSIKPPSPPPTTKTGRKSPPQEDLDPNSLFSSLSGSKTSKKKKKKRPSTAEDKSEESQKKKSKTKTKKKKKKDDDDFDALFQSLV